MTDETKVFREKLQELTQYAAENGDRVSVGKIRDAFEGLSLDEEKLQMVYAYLDQTGIQVYDPLVEDVSHDGSHRPALEAYLEELDAIAGLPADLELKMFHMAAEGDKEARDTLIARYLAAACDLAGEFEGEAGRAEAEDLIQEANVGLLTAMNELSNHDHSRFLTRTNHIAARVGQFDYDAASDGVSRPVMREAVIMQMTWPGAPAVYYGDEAGVCGFTDPDNRRTYPWGKEEREMLEFHRQAIRMHRKHAVLRTGSLRMLGGEENCLFYGRFDENEQIITAFNNAQHETAVRIPVWEAGVPENCEMERIFCSDLTGFTEERERFPVRGGFLTLTLPAVSALVLKSATAGEGSSVSKNKN